MSQHLEALTLANATRTKVSQLKSDLATGSANPLTTITETDLPIKVQDLIGALPWCGEVFAQKVCREAEVRPTARVRELHEVQRKRLAVALGNALVAREARRRAAA
jgi:hypothetical protein